MFQILNMFFNISFPTVDDAVEGKPSFFMEDILGPFDFFILLE